MRGSSATDRRGIMRRYVSVGLAATAVWLAALTATRAAGDLRPDDWMSAADLKATFSGVTIVGHYADGRAFKESYLENGRLKYAEESRHRALAGHWSIVSGNFCTIYDINPTGGCFRVRRHSANCFEFYFLVRTEDEARKPKPGRPSWSARAWRNDRPSTCREKPIA